MSKFSDEDRQLMEQAAQGLVKRRFAVPAIMFLETVSPMNMVSSSMLHMLSPVWRSVVPKSRIDHFATLLERRDSIPEFIAIIDEAEELRRREEQASRQPSPTAQQTPPQEENPT